MNQPLQTRHSEANRQSQRKTGIALVCFSAVTFSTAGLFTKSVSAGAWDVIFWRGVSAIAVTLLVLWYRGGMKDELSRFGAPALLAALLGASGTAAFIPAFKLTSIANVSQIWATAPFLSALLAWIALKEKPTKRVLICSALALIGVAITVRGSLEGGHLTGDLLALWMTLMVSGIVVLYRMRPQTPTMLPSVLSSVILLPFAAVFSDPLIVSGTEIGILLCFGLVFAAASVLLAEGARLIPSAQAALLSALETPLAPLWAILLLAEFPSQSAIVGGILIMGAIVYAQGPFARKRARALP